VRSKTARRVSGVETTLLNSSLDVVMPDVGVLTHPG
jgi:hypothetical protein